MAQRRIDFKYPKRIGFARHKHTPRAEWALASERHMNLIENSSTIRWKASLWDTLFDHLRNAKPYGMLSFVSFSIFMLVVMKTDIMPKICHKTIMWDVRDFWSNKNPSHRYLQDRLLSLWIIHHADFNKRWSKHSGPQSETIKCTGFRDHNVRSSKVDGNL